MKTHLTLAAAALAAASAHASIVATSGQMIQVAPPPSLLLHALASRTNAFVINERQNAAFSGLVDVLSPSIGVDYTIVNRAPTSYSGSVNSHVIHSDETNPSDPPVGNIVGTVYPGGMPERGIQFTFGGILDTVRLLDAYTVQVTLGEYLDQIRVLTSVIPSPGTAALLPLVGMLASRHRRTD